MSDTPVELARVDVSAAGGRPKLLLGDLTGDGRMDLLLVQSDDINATRTPHLTTSLTAIDLDGEVLWQVGDVDPEGGSHGADFPAEVWDFDGDGYNEVVAVMDDEFVVVDGRTGAVQETAALPHEDAHDCIVPANLTGGDHPGDLLVKDRYHQIWAVDGDFETLWTHEGTTGHYPWPYDFDGDGRDEVMGGYDFLSPDGDHHWTVEDDVEEHADCIWVADADADGDPEILVGEGGIYAYAPDGEELWRNRSPREVQHLAPGNFRPEEPGLEVAGLDRIVRGGRDTTGQDGIFLVDSDGEMLAEEDRDPGGWLTIVEPVTDWDDADRDYVFGWRRGGGTNPTLYDGHLDPVATLPADGYCAHGDLLGRGTEEIVVMDDDATVRVYASEERTLDAPGDGPLAQPKLLATSTLYPGGELPLDHGR